jgi:hypothetical protein
MHDLLHGLKDLEAPIEPLFADERWNRISTCVQQQCAAAELGDSPTQVPVRRSAVY